MTDTYEFKGPLHLGWLFFFRLRRICLTLLGRFDKCLIQDLKSVTMNTKSPMVLTTILLMTIGASTVAQHDFRNVKWGMSRASVKSTETCKLAQDEGQRIIYECPLADLKAKLMYTFTSSDKLMRTKYFLTPEYMNMNFFIRDYRMFQDLLTQKYGKAASTSVVTVNKATIAENEWAANLLAGNLRLETKWAMDKMEVFLTLSKLGDKPTIQIDYISKEYSEIDLKERKEKIVKEL